jgi:hypothetical protein
MYSGLICGVAALITAFFAYHWVIGVISIVACIIGISVMWGFVDELKDANPDEFKDEEANKSSDPT